MATVMKDMYDLTEVGIERCVSKDDRMTRASSQSETRLENSQTKVLMKTDVSDELLQVRFDERRMNSDENGSSECEDEEFKRWFKMYGKLQGFKRHYNHCVVHHDSASLFQWASEQRKNLTFRDCDGVCTKLTARQITLLDEIGFRWNVLNKREQRWFSMYNQLVDYKIVTGHCKLHNKKQNMKKLGCWVENQRTLYKRLINDPASQCLSKERVDMLNKIGFTWSKKPIEEPVFVTEKKICKIEKTSTNDKIRTLLQDSQIKNIQQTTNPNNIEMQGVKRGVENSTYKPTFIETTQQQVLQHDRARDLVSSQHQRRCIYTHRSDIPIECGQRFMSDIHVQATKVSHPKRIRLSSSFSRNTGLGSPMAIRSPFNFHNANERQSVMIPPNFQHRQMSPRLSSRRIVYKANSMKSPYRREIQRQNYNHVVHPIMKTFEFCPKY